MARDPETNGILMQMPLPQQLNERDLCNIIPTEKDVDGLNAASIGKNVQFGYLHVFLPVKISRL